MYLEWKEVGRVPAHVKYVVLGFCVNLLQATSPCADCSHTTSGLEKVTHARMHCTVDKIKDSRFPVSYHWKLFGIYAVLQWAFIKI